MEIDNTTVNHIEMSKFIKGSEKLIRLRDRLEKLVIEIDILEEKLYDILEKQGLY
jgi:hypothetical protein